MKLNQYLKSNPVFTLVGILYLITISLLIIKYSPISEFIFS